MTAVSEPPKNLPPLAPKKSVGEQVTQNYLMYTNSQMKPSADIPKEAVT